MFVLFPLHTLNFSDSTHIAQKHNPHIADLTKKTFITENSKTARDVSSHSLQVKASNPDIFKTTFFLHESLFRSHETSESAPDSSVAYSCKKKKAVSKISIKMFIGFLKLN